MDEMAYTLERLVDPEHTTKFAEAIAPGICCHCVIDGSLASPSGTFSSTSSLSALFSSGGPLS